MADWAALQLELWVRVAVKLDSADDKAAMRLVCKTLDLAASLTISQFPARLQPHNAGCEQFGSAYTFFCWYALGPAVASYV